MRFHRSVPSSRAEAGFSVIELLIAAAVITVAILGIVSLFPTSYNDVDRSGKQTTALILAQQRIELLRNQTYTSQALAAGPTSETSLAGYPGYTRTTVITDNTPINGVKQIQVTVTTPAAGVRAQLTSAIAK